MSTTQPTDQEVLESAYEKDALGLDLAATDLLVERLDALLTGNELARVKVILNELDENRLSPGVLTGILTLTWHAKSDLGEVRTVLYERVMHALETQYGVSEERRQRIQERLR